MKRKKGSWTINFTETIFSNDFFSVYRDDVIKPDGKDGQYATIEMKNSVTVIALDDENNVFLTKQFRYALERNSIEAVAGAAENDNFLENAKRELKEEIGVTAEEWHDLGKVETNTSIMKDTKHLFLARRLKFEKPEREPTEEIETLKMSLSEALIKTENGEITHDLTCLLLLKADRFLSNNSGKR